MFKLPSLQDAFTLVFSGDPALELPAGDEERENALRVARQTGRWEKWVKPGQVPTVFHVRSLAGVAMSYAMSERSWSATRQRALSHAELAELVLALSLTKVDNLPGFELGKTTEHGFSRVDRATIDSLLNIDPANPALGRTLVLELAGEILERSRQGVPPLS